MTNKQIANAIELHDSGVSWSIVATLMKTTTDKPRKEIKQYEQTNNRIHGAA